MTYEHTPPPAEEETEEVPGRSWRDRVAGLAEIAQSVIATRLAIFEQEFNTKAALLGKGFAAVTAAAALAVVALLLLAALLAALFSQLFHNVALGILVSMLLYAGAAAWAGYFAWKSFSQIKPTEFPATSRELARDAEAIRAALAQDPDPEEGPDPDMRNDGRPEAERDVSDLEARLRAGAE